MKLCLRLKINLKQHKKFTILASFSILFTTYVFNKLFFIVLMMINSMKIQIGIIAFHFVEIQLSVLTLQFIFACLAVRERFKLLNDSLGFVELKISLNKVYLQFSCRIQLKTQKRITIAATTYYSEVQVDVFHNLCDLIHDINSTFTFPMIFMVFHFFFSNMLSYFNFFWSYQKDHENFNFVVMTEGSFLILNYIMHIFFAYSSCSLTDEASKTPVIVSKIVNNKFCDKFREKIFKKFLLQNQYRSLKLETLFFCINWRLLMTVSF